MGKAAERRAEQARIDAMLEEVTGEKKVLPFYLQPDIGLRCALQLQRDRRSGAISAARTQ